MAEQEACTELVDKASQDQIATTFEGESQLLPLLQGLLEAPDNEQTADSGTESGEDQRNGLIAEVQNALDKLSANLRDDATDITPERRSSLLQLVTKLQAGLSASVPAQERRSSVQGRFRRRQRPNRHTVGVSSEELADARRLIEEISSHELTPQPRAKLSMLQKQNSEGCVGQNNTTYKSFLPQKTVVKNAVAKPFSSSNSTVSGNSSSVQTPTESLDFLFNEEEKKPDLTSRSVSVEEQNSRRSSSSDVNIKIVHNAIKQAAIRKSTENLLESEETDEDTTIKVLTTKTDDKVEKEPILNQKTDIVMQTNPIYQKFSSEDKSNKFSTKKLKMKRANTIDIPKPLKFYEDDDDSDCSLPEEDYHQRRRSNYLALRGPIRIGNPGNKNTLPVFEPKTDNDKKFLAFINKHNENDVTKNSIWSKTEAPRETVWRNKFGNIKTAFENASSGPQNNARQFWKSADDAVNSRPKYDGPKISKQSARNLRQMFEEKQKQSQKVPFHTDKNVVTGSLKVKAFEPHNDKTHKFVPQPLPVNKFSHAPQSAFKPIPKKVPALQISKTPVKVGEKEKDLDSPLFLYSPKTLNESSLKPWVSNPGESRVLSLAASKFENVTPPEPVPVKPRKLSKDKVTLPFQQQTEKIPTPYLVRNTEHNTVKQLSGQYDNAKNDCYATYSTVKYTSPQVQYQSSGNTNHHDQSQFNQRSQHQNREYDDNQRKNHHSQYQNRNYDYNQQKNQRQDYRQHATRDQNSQYFDRDYQHRNKDHDIQSHHAHQYHDYNHNQHHQNQDYRQSSSQYNNQQLNRNRDLPQQTSLHYTNQQINRGRDSTYQDSSQYTNQQLHRERDLSHQVSSKYNQQLSHERDIPHQHQKQQSFIPRDSPHSHQYTSSQYQNQHQIPQKYVHQQTDHKHHQNESERRNSHGYPSKQDNQSQHYDRTTPQEYNHSQKAYEEPQYTSTLQYQPKLQTPDVEKQQTETTSHPPKFDSQVSVESVHEYNAVSSRVMAAPVSQQATTVRQKSPMNRNEHDMAAALNLRNTLQKVSPRPDTSSQKANNDQTKTSPVLSPKERYNSPVNFNYRSEDNSPSGFTFNYRNVDETPSPNNQIKEPPKIMSPPSYNYKSREHPRVVSPNTFSYKPREEVRKPVSPHSFSYKKESYNERRPAPIESLEINDHGESVVTSKFQIPVINVPESPRPPSQAKVSSKADSWNQICIQNQQPMHKPSPRASPNCRTVSKSKSSHSLAIPKQFEAGMTKDEMSQKRKTMEAFLGAKSPQPLSRTSSNENLSVKCDTKVTKRAINRVKTSEKVSTYRQSSGLSRSRTLPDIVCPDMLDETNVDKAFEDLFKSST